MANLVFIVNILKKKAFGFIILRKSEILPEEVIAA